jgi:hypothetical protein
VIRFRSCRAKDMCIHPLWLYDKDATAGKILASCRLKTYLRSEVLATI